MIYVSERSQAPPRGLVQVDPVVRRRGLERAREVLECRPQDRLVVAGERARRLLVRVRAELESLGGPVRVDATALTP